MRFESNEEETENKKDQESKVEFPKISQPKKAEKLTKLIQ